MVFYNKILHFYVLIELKTTNLLTEAVGQLNMYLNYYANEVNAPEDNPPIGIILCTDKGNFDVQYALGGLSNQIFASKYVLYMPDKEQLIAQVEAVLEKWHGSEEQWFFAKSAVYLDIYRKTWYNTDNPNQAFPAVIAPADSCLIAESHIPHRIRIPHIK